MREINQLHDVLAKGDSNTAGKSRALNRLQTVLIATQELGDEKLHLVQKVQDLIENKTRQLNLDFQNLGKKLFLIFILISSAFFIFVHNFL